MIKIILFKRLVFNNIYKYNFSKYYMVELRIGKYKHYKGKEYEVIGVGKHSETLENLVVYNALYEGEFKYGSLWIRPIKMFFETVLINGKEVLRFEFIGE